jgi:hypothetical protein
VKVDVGRLAGADKENVMPSPMTDMDKHAQEKIAEEQKRAREEQLRVQKEAEERRKWEQAEVAAKAAKEERLRQEELARKQAEEERLRQEAEAERSRQEERLRQEAEEERLRQEAAEMEAAVQASERMAELQAAQSKVGLWCKTHGYADVYAAKTTMRGNKKYALHTAIKHGDFEAVKMLLLCGAKKDVKDSKGQTALQLAEKMKPGRPREAILAALR